MTTATLRSSRYGTHLAICLMALAFGACGSQAGSPGTVLTEFKVRDRTLQREDSPRHVLVINGRRIEGPVRASYKGQVIYLNDEQWLPRPKVVTQSTDSAYEVLTPADSIQHLKIPFVARGAVRGRQLLPKVNEFYRRQNSSGRQALRAYIAAKERGEPNPQALAIAQMDTAVAETRSTSAHAPQFNENSVNIYFPGYGWERFSKLPPGAKLPGGPIDEREGRARAEELARLFSDPRQSVVVVITADAAITLRGGPKAEMAARQVDILFSSDSAKIDLMLRHTEPNSTIGIPGSALHALRFEMLAKKVTR